MKLFITGGAGFIGSNFINLFFKKYGPTNTEFSVINFDALYYSGRIENIDMLVPCTVVEIRDSSRRILGRLDFRDRLARLK